MLKALVGAFNQEKALIGAFSMNTNLHVRGPSFQALLSPYVSYCAGACGRRDTRGRARASPRDTTTTTAPSIWPTTCTSPAKTCSATSSTSTCPPRRWGSGISDHEVRSLLASLTGAGASFIKFSKSNLCYVDISRENPTTLVTPAQAAATSVTTTTAELPTSEGRTNTRECGKIYSEQTCKRCLMMIMETNWHYPIIGVRRPTTLPLLHQVGIFILEI